MADDQTGNVAGHRDVGLAIEFSCKDGLNLHATPTFLGISAAGLVVCLLAYLVGWF